MLEWINPSTIIYMSKGDNYNLTAKQAANILGKSVTTIHRYVTKGKLTGKYVHTDHGKELRLKDSEVRKLAEELSRNEPGSKDKTSFSSKRKNCIHILELLEKYEQTLYQLGQLSERLRQKEKQKNRKVNQLEEKIERLESELSDKQSIIEAMDNELSRPLSFLERLRGKRITNN